MSFPATDHRFRLVTVCADGRRESPNADPLNCENAICCGGHDERRAPTTLLADLRKALRGVSGVLICRAGVLTLTMVEGNQRKARAAAVRKRDFASRVAGDSPPLPWITIHCFSGSRTNNPRYGQSVTWLAAQSFCCCPCLTMPAYSKKSSARLSKR
jgi:hypothetical protein